VLGANKHSVRRDVRRCPRLGSLVRRLTWLMLISVVPSWWLVAGAADAATAPSNTAKPTISGTAKQGDKLTATDGTWSGTTPITYSFRWSDGQIGKTITLSAADVGKKVSVTVTASNSAGKASATSASVGPVLPAAPVKTSAPMISGTPQQGDTLIVSDGTWSNNPTEYSYVWQDCNTSGAACADVKGATSDAYSLQATDVGKTVRSVVTAINAGGSGSASSSVTAVVVAAGKLPTPVSSTTALVASPPAAVTNQNVTLIATVTSSVSAAPPSGTITFEDGGRPIGGCADVPIAPTGQSVTVVCANSFTSGTAPFTAVFTPSPGSIVTGSASPTYPVNIGRDASSTSLDVSNPVNVGVSTTYTATVAPPPTRPGPVEPTGSVEFFDGGQPIGSCLDQQLTDSSATCTVTYKATGDHEITARYLGDGDFAGSSSRAEPVSAVPVPPYVAGTITSTMAWTFYYTPSYTQVRALVLNGVSALATLDVKCHGHGCPFADRAMLVGKIKRCGPKTARVCRTQRSIDLVSGFGDRRLAVGARITITIARPSWIGKYYEFTVRARRGPSIRIACLAPGGTRPVGC
jgi:Bacterial Ig-like domain (group 3)